MPSSTDYESSETEKKAGPVEADSSDPPSDTEKEAPERIESDLIDLPAGTELVEHEAAALQRAVATRLIVIAGPAECGKTTLLISVYELFQWRRVCDYLFAGCRTLPAFERRCFDSRIASERSTPETRRTRYEDNDVRYLHLAIAHESALNEHIDLLFTDLSGETFDGAKDSTFACQQLTFLQRAAHFVALLDGQKFIDPAKRWAAVQEIQLLLRSCLDSGMIGKHNFVEVMVTKYDYFEIAADRAEVETAFTNVESEFRTRFENRVGQLRFSRTAARPVQNPALGFAYGVPEFLQRMANSTPQARLMQLTPNTVTGSRESIAYFARYFARR